MSIKRNQYIVVGIIILFTILLLIDRFYWAQISQWREDQATNMWLGYTVGIRNIPVGLMSSKGIPNPNGMVILGFFLSALPNLLSVSFFLGFVQITLLVLVGWKSSVKNWHYFLLATIPTLSSVILRSSSVEYWNQYTITLVNIFFVFWLLSYLENLSLWNLPPIALLILLAPSLYLAGLANAIVMTLLTLGLLVYKKPSTKFFRVVLIVILILVILSLVLTWLPYFQNVSLTQITDYNKTRLGLFDLIGLPIYATSQWADKSIFAMSIKHADPKILSGSSQALLSLVGWAYTAQVVFAFTTIIFLVFTIRRNKASLKPLIWKFNTPAASMVAISAVFILLSYTVSAVLGAPAWINSQRLDQTVQFLPIMLMLIFFLPLMISAGSNTEKIITKISYGSLIIFGTVNLLCGFMIIRDHLQYRGNVLSEADVPLTHKMQVIDFIANDWGKHSDSNIIPVDYDLGGDVWDWVPKFGRKLEKWYPAPMTIGRSFDYEFRRGYGLTNYQEGVQLRTFGNGRYLVTYAFEEPPQIEGARLSNYIFGRLRVSVVER